MTIISELFKPAYVIILLWDTIYLPYAHYPPVSLTVSLSYSLYIPRVYRKAACQIYIGLFRILMQKEND